MTTSRGATATAARVRGGDRLRGILEEAADLFAERGFSAVAVQEIGQRVGVTGGAIYRHFESKEALLHAILVETIDAWVAAAAPRGAPGPEDPHRRVRELIDAGVRLAVERPGPLATYLRERHRADAATKRLLARRERQLSGLWRAALSASRPELTADEIALRLDAINGVLSALALRPESLASGRTRAVVVQGLLAIALATSPTPEVPPATRSTWTPPFSRRRQILAAALELFSERGYHGVGMDEIGEAAGITGPAIYEYFTAKSDILLDAYDRAGALVVAGIDDALRQATSASDALHRLAISFVTVASDGAELITVTSREGHALPDAERPRLARRRRAVHESWIGVLRELRPELTAEETRLLVAAALALVIQVARNRRRLAPIDGTVALVCAFLLAEPRRPA